MSDFYRSPPRRGVPLSPSRTPTSSYYDKAIEVSNQFNNIEDRVSSLEEECRSFRKAVNSGRRMVEEERRQIALRAKNIEQRVSTPSPHRSRERHLINESDSESDFLAAKKEVKNLKSQLYSINNNKETKYSRRNYPLTPNREHYQDFDAYRSDEIRHKSHHHSSSRHNYNNNQYKSNSISDISPTLSKHYDRCEQEASEYNQKIKDIREQLVGLEKRSIEAKRSLAEPIGDIESDEIIAEEAERSMIKTKSLLHRNSSSGSYNSQNSDSFADIDDNISQIEFLESQNEKKTKELNIKRKRLDEDRVSIYKSRSSPQSPAKIPTKHHRKTDHTHQYSNSNNKYSTYNNNNNNNSNKEALKQIDDSYDRLKERSVNIQLEEEEIDRNESEMINQRKQMESDWKAKMKRIERLSSMKQMIDKMALNVHSEETEVAQLGQFLEDLEDERFRLMKRLSNSLIESTSRASAASSPFSANDEEKNSRSHKKQMKINSKSREISTKKRHLEKLQEDVKKATIEMNLYKERVEHLELQVEEISKTTSERLEENKQETIELSKTLTSKSNNESNRKNKREKMYYANSSSSYDYYGGGTEEFSDIENSSF